MRTTLAVTALVALPLLAACTQNADTGSAGDGPATRPTPAR